MPRIVLAGPEAQTIKAAWRSSIPPDVEVVCTDDRGVAYYQTLDDTVFVLADELSIGYLYKTFALAISEVSEGIERQEGDQMPATFGYRGGKSDGKEVDKTGWLEIGPENVFSLESVLSGECSYAMLKEKSVKRRNDVVRVKREKISADRRKCVREAAETLQFDVLEFTGEELEQAVVNLLEPYLEVWGWQEEQLERMVACAHTLYRDSPYHSWSHAVDVVQFMSLVLSIPQVSYLFSPIEQASTMLAALLHDIDHDGVTNKGHAALSSDRHRHSPRATQEQHHLAIARRLLSSHGHLDALLHTNLITKLIDSTDMASHASFVKQIDSNLVKRISSFESHSDMPSSDIQTGGTSSPPTASASSDHSPSSSSSSNSPIFELEQDRHLLLIAIMKASDLSNTVRTIATSRKWGVLLGQEFRLAFLREQSANIPPNLMSFHGDPLPAHDKVQLSFFKNVILPFYQLLSQIPILRPFMLPLVQNALLGVQHFEALSASDSSSNTPTHDNEV